MRVPPATMAAIICTGGGSLSRWFLSGRVSVSLTETYAPPPPLDRMTHDCQNITLPKISFAGGTNLMFEGE